MQAYTTSKSAVLNLTGYTAQLPSTPVPSASPSRFETTTKRNTTSIKTYNIKTSANESVASSLYKSKPKSDSSNLRLGVAVVLIGLLVLYVIIAATLHEHCGYNETTSKQISCGVVLVRYYIFLLTIVLHIM